MKVQAEVKLHNRFDVEVREAGTGKLKQKAQALNIVLNQMWTRLCAGSGYFGAIQFGSGSGTLTPARTSLFSHLGARWAADVTIIRALPTSSWRRRIVLNPEEFVGAVLSEVGIASSSGINDLVTHAMLEDSEGNPITITKTDVDVVTIFATVFVTFSTPSGVVLIGMPNSNSLVNWLAAGGSAPAGSFSLGEAVGAGHNSLAGIGSQPSLGGSPAVTWTADTPNRRRVSSVVRFGTTVGNGHVAEFAFSSLFRAELPLAGVFPGQPYTGVPVGTGDGSARSFTLPSRNIAQGSIVMKLNGVVATAYTAGLVPAVNYRFVTLSTPGSAQDVALSADGAVLALVLNANNVMTFDRVGVAWVRRPDPAAGLTGTGRGVALSPAGLLVAAAHDNAPFVTTYDWSGSAWLKRPDPAVPPPSSGIATALSANGLVLAVAHWNTPFIATYEWSGSAWVRRPNPGVLPPDNCHDAALSSNGAVLALAHATAPFVTTYDWSGSAWVRRPDPGVLPTGTGRGVALSANGLILAVAHSTSPFITTYDWSGSAWIKRPDPNVLPTSEGRVAQLSAEGSILAMSQSSSPFLIMYDWSGSAWLRRPNPGVLPGGSVLALSPDGFSVCAPELFAVFVYDAAPRTTRITFDTAPATGVAVTADYMVNGVHKTDQFVIDAGLSLQFGTP